jgi:OFA family oxalate/formate antiporter-like MFS transporter
MMFIGHLLLKKPEGWHEPQDASEKQSIINVIKTRPIKNYIGIWLMFYINITCGLALISQEKSIIKCLGLASFVGVLSTVSAIFNAGGRLGFSAWGDKMKDRNTIYKIIFVISIVLTLLVVLTGGIANGYGNGLLIALVIALIMMVNAGYGGGFSNVPTLLSDHYGMGSISALHGITLSAWAFAGLSGNQLANWIVTTFGKEIEVAGNMVNPTGYQMVLYVTLALYVVAFVLSMVFVKHMKKEN